MIRVLLLLIVFIYCGCQSSDVEKITPYEVIVIGEGTGAAAAAIQSARSGTQTILITPSVWLGGMLTAAGVSATDGNHQLPAGLWGEFRDSLRKHYGGADSLFTGWVSNTMFEPKVGEHYWKQMAAKEDKLEIRYNTHWQDITQEDELWKVTISDENGIETIYAKMLIDGTDLGDIAATVGATFDIGMDDRTKTGETMAPEKGNDIIQDLTYAAILQDFGVGADKTIPKPDGYDRNQFLCACEKFCENPEGTVHPCETMISYGKLPNGKYMINWPLKGNDYYANIIEKNSAGRAEDLAKAKNKTLQFIYFIQAELGYKHLGLAEDEFPTEDGFPLMAYHREGRRIHGLVQLNVNHILIPYKHTLYRTGIAVGDYPIDHHHFERPDAPEINFPMVPSFSIPMGALIPRGVNNLLVADKAISVTNIVNGSSRLQPVIVQIGQVAGLMAGLATAENKSPEELEVRKVQAALLEENGYLLPFIDTKPEDTHYKSIQKTGATGLMKGKGIPYKWANQTWFYPDSTISVNTLLENIKAFGTDLSAIEKSDELVTLATAYKIIQEWDSETSASADEKEYQRLWEEEWDLKSFELNRPIKRYELAVLLDKGLEVFERPIDIEGKWED